MFRQEKFILCHHAQGIDRLRSVVISSNILNGRNGISAAERDSLVTQKVNELPWAEHGIVRRVCNLMYQAAYRYSIIVLIQSTKLPQ